LDTNFLKIVSSAIVDKYIGESARLIREMFGKLILFPYQQRIE
jgi:ATP-dependent 26S proteasome regulatory subunit